jgi:glycerol uptake operon antiterminator
MNNLKELLSNNHVIAAIRNNEELESVLKNNIKIVFVLYGSIVDIEEICKKLKNAKKTIFIHIDMLDGIKSDHKGIEYIKNVINPFGIITTKLPNIKYATSLGLNTIQRVFLIDSQSLQTGINNIHTAKPSAIEVMPGVAYKIIETIKKDIQIPIIAGGLIYNQDDVNNAISSGALAISTSNQVLWNTKE